MITQEFDLNLIPEQEPVVVHVDQYDHGAGRFIINLYDGEVGYAPDGTVTVQGTKPDGHGFDYSASLTGNVVTVDLTEQMTAVAGDVRAQIVVTESSDRTGTFVFIIRVQKSALPDDTEMSESDYQLIQKALEDAEAWAVGEVSGEPVGPDSPMYHNNSKYWAGKSEEYAQGGLKWKGSVAFAKIPTTGMSYGDMYNITDDFTTDSRFDEGAGVKVKAGTNIAWSRNDKWDLLATGMEFPIPLPITQGGTGNTDGYIRTGIKSGTTAGMYATIEGTNNTATGYRSHAEGYGNTVTSAGGHVEGQANQVSNANSHAEGQSNNVSGNLSHAEGQSNQIIGSSSHAEGSSNVVRSNFSHAEGQSNEVGYACQHVSGKFNDNKSYTLLEVGNGSFGARHNAFEVYENGDINVNGNIRINGSILPIGGGGVTSFNGRTGVVSPTTGDYDATQVKYSAYKTVKEKIDQVEGDYTPVHSCAVGDTSAVFNPLNVSSSSIIKVLTQTVSGEPIPWKSITLTGMNTVTVTFPSALTEAGDMRLQIINP